MARSPEGEMWVGTPSGLLVIDPLSGQLLRSVTAFRDRNVTTVRFDENGNLWVGTQTGLFIVNRYNGAILREIPGLPSSRILELSPDTGNKVWVGTSEGLGWVSLTTGVARPLEAFGRP
jgi:ligand-binding sensor domain-containing protein